METHVWREHSRDYWNQFTNLGSTLPTLRTTGESFLAKSALFGRRRSKPPVPQVKHGLSAPPLPSTRPLLIPPSGSQVPSREPSARWLEVHALSARELRQHAEEAKGLFIKAGQARGEARSARGAWRSPGVKNFGVFCPRAMFPLVGGRNVLK